MGRWEDPVESRMESFAEGKSHVGKENGLFKKKKLTVYKSSPLYLQYVKR